MMSHIQLNSTHSQGLPQFMAEQDETTHPSQPSTYCNHPCNIHPVNSTHNTHHSISTTHPNRISAGRRRSPPAEENLAWKAPPSRINQPINRPPKTSWTVVVTRTHPKYWDPAKKTKTMCRPLYDRPILRFEGWTPRRQRFFWGFNNFMGQCGK